MEIYKDLSSPASKEFEKLLKNEISKTKDLVEGTSKIRGKVRSLFYEGIADAMADQWGSNETI